MIFLKFPIFIHLMPIIKVDTKPIHMYKHSFNSQPINDSTISNNSTASNYFKWKPAEICEWGLKLSDYSVLNESYKIIIAPSLCNWIFIYTESSELGKSFRNLVKCWIKLLWIRNLKIPTTNTIAGDGLRKWFWIKIFFKMKTLLSFTAFFIKILNYALLLLQFNFSTRKCCFFVATLLFKGYLR